ncbi:MAG: Calcium-transporting ATPase [Elusimicrobia bacterium]|nr:Calcium-transporting ATPase [Elusimicrobiota bacterium]
MITSWHERTSSEVAQQIGVEPLSGLRDTDVAERLSKYGFNELIDRGGKSAARVLWEQLTSTMIIILLAAAGISFFLRDYKDAIAILSIIVLNTLLGFSQEYRAERAMAALKKLAIPFVKVRRNGRVFEISSRDIIPGDVVFLEAGNLVPADGRLIETVNLRTQESSLTGESEPIDKDAHSVSAPDSPLGDRRNMVFRGTLVASGRGQFIVTETGMATQLGHIAGMMQKASQDLTPLQKRLDKLAKQLAVIALMIVGVVFLLGLLRGEDLKNMFLIAVSMAVAAVPEGLPAVVTISLALGAQRMLKRHALIRKLPAVETLGSVTVICSDKTGTLTQNQMTVTVLDVAGHSLELQQSDHRSLLEEKAAGKKHSFSLLLAGAALCNDAVLNEESGVKKIVGDPTEGALLVMADRWGLSIEAIGKKFPRVNELAFDSNRKRMTTIHTLPEGDLEITAGLSNKPFVAFSKGALDGLLELSSSVWLDGAIQSMNGDWRERINAANRKLTEKGMRVLGVAFRPLDFKEGKAEILEKDLTFVGLIGMVDPPRPEAKEAVEKCRLAGIRPVMITGDHPLTAHSIASHLGITTTSQVLTGQELNHMTVEELMKKVDEVSVYARVSPEHKLKIIEALQKRGHNVAMTGDGVNDAPALKKADIGVAMGITGTDVTKEAADMVLLDDNFATIVSAIEEGRVIYDNIRKFIKYLLTTNSAEILVMLLAPFLGMPLPLLPLQILWINLVTDGPTALALGVEPAEQNVMGRSPIHASENILGQGMGWHVMWVGLLMTFLSLVGGYFLWAQGQQEWQTMVFTSLTFCQMAHVLAIRSELSSLFKMGIFSNPWLAGAVFLTVGLQILLVYTPVFQEIFHTVPLDARQIGLCALSASGVFLAVEVEKGLKRRSVK